jgi:hypothetical protein
VGCNTLNCKQLECNIITRNEQSVMAVLRRRRAESHVPGLTYLANSFMLHQSKPFEIKTAYSCGSLKSINPTIYLCCILMHYMKMQTSGLQIHLLSYWCSSPHVDVARTGGRVTYATQLDDIFNNANLFLVVAIVPQSFGICRSWGLTW